MLKSTFLIFVIVLVALPDAFGQIRSLIRGLQSGKCITVHFTLNDNGAGIEIYDCVLGAKNQFWTMRDAGQSGNPAITQGYNFVVEHSGKCLTVLNQRTDNSAPLIQWDCIAGGINNQMWEVISSNQDGYYQIRNPVSNKCVTVLNSVTTNYASLILWDCINAPNQKWFQNQPCM